MANVFRRFIKGIFVDNELDNTKKVAVTVNDSATTNTTTTIESAQTADRTVTIPDATDTLVGKATTDVLTNKTIDGDNNTLQDIGITSLKTEVIDAGKFIIRDGLGAPQSGNTVPSGTVVGDTDSQTLTNKTIDGTLATGTNTVTADAGNVTYDPTTSGLTATDSQAAIDEVEGRLDTAESGKLDGPGTHSDNVLVKTNGINTNVTQVTGVTVDGLNNVTGVNDLTVGGNLQVNGTTTTLNTATLDVTDTNITVNKTGNDISSEGAGLTVERTGTNGSIIYEDALASKFKLGALGSEVEIMDVSSSQTTTNKNMSSSTNTVDTASTDSFTRNTGNQQVVTIPDTTGADNFVLEGFTQTLTNKDIDGGIASNTNRITLPKNTTATLDTLIDKEATVAYNTDLNTVVFNDGVQWNRLEGSGQSGINYITNPDGEGNTTSGWNAYDDASGTAPIDGTGGVPSSSVLSVVNATTLRGSYYFNLLDSAGTPGPQGEGISTDFAIDTADTESTLQVSFDYNTSGGYLSGYVKVFIYDIDNATLLGAVTNDESGDILAHTDPSRKFVAQFETTNSLNYRLIFHYTTADTTGSIFNFDNVKVSPVETLIGFNSTDWEVYTPTITGSTTDPVAGAGATLEGRWRRVGDSMEIYLNYLQSVSGSVGSGDYLFSIPTGYVIDSTKLTSGIGNTVQGLVGSASAQSTTSGTQTGFVQAYNTTNLAMIVGDDVENPVFVSSTRHALSDAIIRYTFRAVIPIQNWTSTNIISNTELNITTLRSKASASAAITQTTSPTTAIIFNTVEYNKSGSYSNSTGLFTAPKQGYYRSKAQISIPAAGTNANQDIYLYKNSLTIISSTEAYIATGSGGQTVEIDCTTYLQKGDTLEIRSANSQSQSSNIGADKNYFEVEYKPDFTTYGVIGEKNKVQTKLLTAASSLNTTLTDLTFNNLTIGKWYEITGQALFNLDSGTSNSNATLSVVHNGSNVAQLNTNLNEGVDTSIDTVTMMVCTKFQATSTSVTFVTSNMGIGSSILGNSSRSETFMQIEQRNDLTETSEF